MIPAGTWITRKNLQLFRNFEQGGGAIFLSGHGNPHLGIFDGKLTGTLSRCLFIDNEGFKGGALYITSTSQDGGDALTIDECTFVGNVSFKGGGAICVSDKNEIGDTEVRICSSKFISNVADEKGGAVYNRIGSTTIMVNCVIAGNGAEQEGGGTCNAVFEGTASTRMDLHNCLLVGNWTDDGAAGGFDVGGGHFNRQKGISTLINCTLVDNYAGNKYGGVANRNAFSKLIVRNSIVWGNTDGDSGTTGVQEELHYEDDTLLDNDVDNNVIKFEDGEFIVPGGDLEVNTSDIPGFGAGVSSLSWNTRTYDPDTGQTTFKNLSGLIVNEHVDKLFKPDKTGIPYLLIISNTTTEIVCLGKTGKESGPGSVFNPFLCVTPGCGFVHAAEDFGDTLHLPPDDTNCDLDGQVNIPDRLPLDLYLNVRDQGVAPDAGVHEVDVP